MKILAVLHCWTLMLIASGEEGVRDFLRNLISPQDFGRFSYPWSRPSVSVLGPAGRACGCESTDGNVRQICVNRCRDRAIVDEIKALTGQIPRHFLPCDQEVGVNINGCTCVHATLPRLGFVLAHFDHNFRPLGAMVVYDPQSGGTIRTFVRGDGAFNLEVAPAVTYMFDSAVIQPADNRAPVVLPLTATPPSCPALRLGRTGELRIVTPRRKKRKTNLTLAPDLHFDDSDEYHLLEVPEHLEEETRGCLEDQRLLWTALHAFKCKRASYVPLKSYVGIPVLFDSETKWTSDYAALFDSDPECQRFSLARSLPPGAIIQSRLVCFPGSGSKWVIDMMGLLTGFSTNLGRAQVHWLLKTHHDDFLKVNEAMEMKKPRNSSLIVRMFEIYAADGRALLLLRRPLDAVASWWNHVLLGTGTAPRTLEGEMLEESMKTARFCQFATAELSLWKSLALDYLTLVPDLLVIFYEKVLEDPEFEMRRMLKFLKFPIDEDRLGCMRKHPLNRHKRDKKRVRVEDLICPEAIAIAKEVTQSVDDAIRELGIEGLPKEYFSQ